MPQEVMMEPCMMSLPELLAMRQAGAARAQAGVQAFLSLPAQPAALAPSSAAPSTVRPISEQKLVSLLPGTRLPRGTSFLGLLEDGVPGDGDSMAAQGGAAQVTSPGASVHDHDGWRAKLAHVLGDAIADENLDKAELRKKVLMGLQMIDSEGGEAPAASPDAAGEGEEDEEAKAKKKEEEEKAEDEAAEAGMEEWVKAYKNHSDPSLKTLFESIKAETKLERRLRLEEDQKQAAAAYGVKLALARKLIMESKLSQYREITEHFVGSVAALPDERRMKDKINDELARYARQRPTSAASYIGGGANGGKTLSNEQVATFLKTGRM